MLHKNMRRSLLLAFLLCFSINSFVERPQPVLNDLLKMSSQAGAVVDHSTSVARLLFGNPGVSVVRFIHTEKNVDPVQNLTKTLPSDLQKKVRLYQVNAARCMSLLKHIAFKASLSKLELPAIMFFHGSGLTLPIERGDVVRAPLYELIRSRVGNVR